MENTLISAITNSRLIISGIILWLLSIKKHAIKQTPARVPGQGITTVADPPGLNPAYRPVTTDRLVHEGGHHL